MASLKFKHLIYVGCSDSRHVGFPDSRVLEKIGNPEVHVISNAGADVASGDLANLINKLAKTVRNRKEILVVATAHMNPDCGGAHVDEKAIKTLKNDLKKLKFNLQHYLNAYEYGEKEVFSSVAPNPVSRAKNQAGVLKLYGTSYVTGLYSLSESLFQPLFASEDQKDLQEAFFEKIVGGTFEGDKKLLEHQKPTVLLLSAIGRHARLEDAHQTPGKAFHVSIGIEGRKPTPKTVLSLIYYAHLNPGNAEVRLVGGESELKALRKFVNSDELLQHMIRSDKWKIKEKLV